MMTVFMSMARPVSTIELLPSDDYDRFTDDVPVDCQAGDVISVTLFTSGGSSKSQDMTVRHQIRRRLRKALT